MSEERATAVAAARRQWCVGLGQMPNITLTTDCDKCLAPKAEPPRFRRRVGRQLMQTSHNTNKAKRVGRRRGKEKEIGLWLTSTRRRPKEFINCWIAPERMT